MPKINPTKLHLLEERNELMWFLDYRGFNGQEIGEIFNVDRSWVREILTRKPKKWLPKYVASSQSSVSSSSKLGYC